jgi:putative transcriptional regulator
MIDVFSGKLLIADPFLKDPNFMRTVVFMCEHKDEGSFGFVLNKKHDQHLGELLQGYETSTFPVYYGGPVQLDTLHFLHQRPDLIPGGFEVINGIYWGGDFEAVLDLMKGDELTEKDIRFFIGYSGWGEGQLDEEMKIKSWITTDGTKRLIFRSNIDDTWKDSLKQIGGDYVQLINYPIDPQLN